MMFSLLLTMSLGADPVGRIDPVSDETPDIQGTRLFPPRTGYLISALQTALPLDRPLPDTALKDILDFLQDISTPIEAAKDPSKRIFITVDHPAFKRWKADPAYNVEDEKISLPKLNGASLETALRLVTDQLNATFVIKRETIVVTTWAKAIGRAPKENEEIKLIHWAVEKRSLDSVLDGIADRYDQSIVISSQAEEKAKKPVSARFLNVPLEDAVTTLADMNELKVVRKSNLYYLIDPKPKRDSSPERINTAPKELKLSRQRFPFPEFAR